MKQKAPHPNGMFQPHNKKPLIWGAFFINYEVTKCN